MDNITLSKWLKYINEWVDVDNQYTKNSELKIYELKRARFVEFKFSFLDTKSKNSIKNILLNKDNIHLLTTQYNQENNSYIFTQLNPIISPLINSGFYFSDIYYKKIIHKYIIMYYLFLCSNDIVEKIHWSYFRIDLLNSMIKKNISIKKIIEIVNWNFIYNNELFDKLNIVNNIYKSNSADYKILLDYINGLNGIISNNVSLIPSKYNSVIKKINDDIESIKFNLSNNYSNPIIIKELLLKNDDKIFDKLLVKTKLKTLINSISYILKKSNIGEKNILKLITLCGGEKKISLLTSNSRLFVKLLYSGYVYSIEKIWTKSIPLINWKIFTQLKIIILKSDTSLFEHLLKSKILDKYLYLNNPYKIDLWLSIIILTTGQISIILNKYNYKIPYNVLKSFCLIFNNLNKKKTWRRFRSMRKYNLCSNLHNFIFNLKTFNIPINENLLDVIFNFMTDEQIIIHINSNIKIIDLDHIIYLTLNYNRFGLLKKLFVNFISGNKNIIDKIFFENNIGKYTKNIYDKNKIASVYSYCIKNLGFRMKKKYEIFALKYRTINLLKTILGKQKKILNPKNVIRYLFNYGSNINKWGGNLTYSGKKQQKLFIKTYDFLKSNMVNWNDVYKSTQVCKLTLELFSYTFDDYLAMVESNYSITFDMNFFISNKYVDNDLKKMVLIVNAEINNNHEYFLKKKLGNDDGSKYIEMSEEEKHSIIKKFDEILDKSKIENTINIYY